MACSKGFQQGRRIREGTKLAPPADFDKNMQVDVVGGRTMTS